jgi:hypothetical protein
MAPQRVELGGELRRAHRSSSSQQGQASMERTPLRLRSTSGGASDMIKSDTNQPCNISLRGTPELPNRKLLI